MREKFGAPALLLKGSEEKITDIPGNKRRLEYFWKNMEREGKYKQ